MMYRLGDAVSFLDRSHNRHTGTIERIEPDRNDRHNKCSVIIKTEDGERYIVEEWQISEVKT